MQIIESILGTALLGLAAIAFMEVAEVRINERDAIAAGEDVRAVQAAVIQHHRRNPHDTISEWITGGYPPCPAGYTGTGTDGQCRRDVTASNPYCPNGNLANWQGQTRCTLWTYSACPADMSKLQNQWCVGRPFYHYSCDAQDTHHGVQTAIGMGMGMGANALPGGNPWCERALEIPWKDLRDVAPERLGALNFQGRLFHGLHRSPYSSEYRLMTNGVDDTLRLEFEVTGLDEMARLMYGDRLPGKQVDVEPRPDAAVHGEDTVFTVGVGITPGLSNAFSKYALDAVDRGADGTEGALESPLYWASTRLDDGTTEEFPGGDCTRFAAGAITTAANGYPMHCRVDANGDLTWKPAHTIDDDARLELKTLGACTGAAGEVAIALPGPSTSPTSTFSRAIAAINAAKNAGTGYPEINLLTGEVTIKTQAGVLIHTIQANTWRSTAVLKGTGCLTAQSPPSTAPPAQPAECTGATGEVPMHVPKTLLDNAHTWAWGTGADKNAVIATKDSDGTEMLRVSKVGWEALDSQGTLCLKEGVPLPCPAKQERDGAGFCKPKPALCDFDLDGEDNTSRLSIERAYVSDLAQKTSRYFTVGFDVESIMISYTQIRVDFKHWAGSNTTGTMQCLTKPSGELDLPTLNAIFTPDVIASFPTAMQDNAQRFSKGECASLNYLYWRDGYFDGLWQWHPASYSGCN